MVLRGRGEWEILLRGIFLSGDGNQISSDFDHLKLFQS